MTEDLIAILMVLAASAIGAIMGIVGGTLTARRLKNW